MRRNREWAAQMKENDPIFFEKLAHNQSPKYLWIGCSDSRVPACQIVDLPPGEMFVHRNVANLIIHSDFNCLSVIQYAIDILQIQHIIVCGHYGCGGVLAALNNQKLGLIDRWLSHLQKVQDKHRYILSQHPPPLHWDILCELNTLEQVFNLTETTIVQDAWAKGRELTLHGWMYKLHDGLLQDLKVDINALAKRSDAYERALTLIQNRST